MLKTEIKQQNKEDYSKINLSLDKIFRELIGSQPWPRQEVAPPSPKQDLLSNVKFPLESCEEISLLEEQIRNDEFRTQLIDFLSNIGGRTGVRDGLKIAYKVVDYVFKREVLMQYSWTGVSRGYSRHTEKRNCAIFKNGVLKHAKKRAARKRPQPTSASTGNNLITDIKEEDVMLDETNTDLEVYWIENDAENTE